MYSLVFYCGLISSVVSAHFINDTSHDGGEDDINTTLSTLPHTAIPVSKDCVLEMNENEISQIVELFNSNLVNVVVIHVSFSNSSHEGQLFSDFNVSLSNPIGREILHALAGWEFRFVTWTLKAGIRRIILNVKESQNDCLKTGKNASDFVLESTQHIVDSINLATNYQVCSSFKETSSAKVAQTCCQMTKPNLATKFNYKCPKGNSFLFESGLLWYVIGTIMFILLYFYLTWLLLVFLSRTGFDLKHPEYYKLEESMMSPSSILCKVIWDENGRVVSFIRSLVIVGVFSYSWYLWYEFLESIYGYHAAICFTSLFVFWEASFLVSNLLRYRITNSSIILDKIKVGCIQLLLMNLVIYHNHNQSRKKGKRGHFEEIVQIMTYSLNPNVWKNTINTLYDKCTTLARCVTKHVRNRIFQTLALCTYYVLAVSICFVCVCILFCLRIVGSIVICHMCYQIMLIRLIISLQHRNDNVCNKVLSHFHATGFCVLPGSLVLVTIIFSILSFLLGLFLNLAYFIPYFALFSVQTFYCYTYWKTMEEKYFVLKQLIYEACRETQNINNGCIPNRHPEPNEEVLLVVSKKLYDEIREELLPYNINLFYFVLKMVWSIAFSLGIFALINMLNEFNVTGLVQVVTTASLGVMPHIFNMVASKTNEAKTKAWNEKLKMNVKYMVEDLNRKDPESARTVLIMEEEMEEDDIYYESSVSNAFNFSGFPCF